MASVEPTSRTNRGRPWRTLDCDGYEVLIGRNAASSALVTRSARRGDAWMHVAGGFPGAHVLIRNGQTAPTTVLQTVAQWAVWHSSARRMDKAKVMIVAGEDVEGADDDGTAHVGRRLGHITTTAVEPPRPDVADRRK